MVTAKNILEIRKTYGKASNVRITDEPEFIEFGPVVDAAIEQTECPVCFRRDLALVQLPDHWASGQCQRAAAVTTKETVEMPSIGSAVTMSWPAADSMKDLEKSVERFVNDVAMGRPYWPNDYVQDISFLAFQMHSRDTEISELQNDSRNSNMLYDAVISIKVGDRFFFEGDDDRDCFTLGVKELHDDLIIWDDGTNSKMKHIKGNKLVQKLVQL